MWALFRLGHAFSRVLIDSKWDEALEQATADRNEAGLNYIQAAASREPRADSERIRLRVSEFRSHLRASAASSK